MYVYVYLYRCKCMCVYIHVCIYIHTKLYHYVRGSANAEAGKHKHARPDCKHLFAQTLIVCSALTASGCAQDEIASAPGHPRFPSVDPCLKWCL